MAARGTEDRPKTYRRRAASKAADNDVADRQFVVALSRGLEVLCAFRAGETTLSNQEIARRTALPKPTVSRLTYTLLQGGFLTYNGRSGSYELGERMLSLGFTALSNLEVRRVARPLMQQLASRGDCNVGLGIRQHHSMLYIDTCEGADLAGLRLYPGSRMPLATTAMGRACLAVLPDAQRSALLAEMAKRHGDEWPAVLRGIEKARRSFERDGFCLSLGEWHRDINGAGTAIVLPGGRGLFAFNAGGPAYLLPAEKLTGLYGPALARLARQVLDETGNG